MYERDPTMPKSRSLTAVPFVGKDVPSERSEFAHPGISLILAIILFSSSIVSFCITTSIPLTVIDIVIGLTILAFRYEGLRESDFITFMKDIQQKMWNEEGAYPIITELRFSLFFCFLHIFC